MSMRNKSGETPPSWDHGNAIMEIVELLSEYGAESVK
jgi:hypothetical protein